MQIEIHDVDHGGCVVITGPQGHRLMLDCGYNLDRPWFPSIAYANQVIQTLMFLNLDEDHVEDLPDLWKRTQINGIFSNPTVTAPALKAMKLQGMRTGVQMAHDILAFFRSGCIGQWNHPLGGVWWHAFWNVFGCDFTDTNNLSLAVFVSYGPFTILFGGDMEASGWKKLLQNPSFVARLPEVKVYVASHHGRDNGRCEALFQHMKPEVVIFSDGAKTYGTQETTDWYGRRVTGIVETSKAPTALGPIRRKVMTTRKDGTLRIEVATNGRFTVFYEKSEPSISDIIAALFPTRPNPFTGALGR